MVDNIFLNTWKACCGLGTFDDDEEAEEGEPPDNRRRYPRQGRDNIPLLALNSPSFDSPATHPKERYSYPSSIASTSSQSFDHPETPSRRVSTSEPSLLSSIANRKIEKAMYINPYFLGTPDDSARELTPISPLSTSPIITANQTSFLDTFIPTAQAVFNKNTNPGFYLGLCWVQGSKLPIQFSGISNEDDDYDHETDIWPWEGMLGDDRSLSPCPFRLEDTDMVASLDCRPSRMSVYDADQSQHGEHNFSVQIIVTELDSLESSRLRSFFLQSIGPISSDAPIMVLRLSPVAHRWLNPVQSVENCAPISMTHLIKASSKVFDSVLSGHEQMIEWSAGVTWRIQRFCADRRKQSASLLVVDPQQDQ